MYKTKVLITVTIILATLAFSACSGEMGDFGFIEPTGIITTNIPEETPIAAPIVTVDPGQNPGSTTAPAEVVIVGVEVPATAGEETYDEGPTAEFAEEETGDEAVYPPSPVAVMPPQDNEGPQEANTTNKPNNFTGHGISSEMAGTQVNDSLHMQVVRILR